MKQCTKCKIDKNDDDFNRSSRSKDGLQSACRDCSKKYYQGNKANHVANVAARRKRYKRELRSLVVSRFSTGCVDCGVTDIRVLEFDHIGGKLDEVSVLIRNQAALVRVVAEMDKCEIRCRNCHKIKTLERIGRTWHDDFLEP